MSEHTKFFKYFKEQVLALMEALHEVEVKYK